MDNINFNSIQYQNLLDQRRNLNEYYIPQECSTCILDMYKQPQCNLPKYGPQQFGPYYDSDPNSVIKYRPFINECKPDTCIVQIFE